MRTLVVVTMFSLWSRVAFAQDPAPPPPPSSSPGAVFTPPVPTSEPSAPVTVDPLTAKKPPSAGWARPAAYISFGLAIAVAGLCVIDDLASRTLESTKDETGSLVMSSVFVGLTVVGVPTISIGGSSARFDHGIEGSKLLRVLGWIAYALALTVDLGVVIDHALNDNATVAPELGGGLGAAAFVAFGFDALWSAQEAEEVASIVTRRDVDPPLQLSPMFKVLRGPAGSTAPSVGVGGRF
jgi:hypothetical protein